MKNISRRNFIGAGAAAGLTLALPAKRLWAANANDTVNLGFISCGGRAGQLMNQFKDLEGVNIAGLCDPDENRVAERKEQFPQAETWNDLRDLIASDSIDAVVVATCNHWHCLAAIWAMEAGKDVYVEKPLSHSQWEGLQTVAAARKYDRICQLGTQQRSDPMQAEIQQFLHDEKGLGDIVAARVNRYGLRGSIGKRDQPLEIERNVEYDLWLGPAQDKPIFRNKLHYDWHWDWNTGSGEMGNWGVHVLDDVRNNVFQDRVVLPQRIAGGGGRIAWNDAGETPNVHFAWFDTGSIPVVIGLSNLPDAEGSRDTASHPGPGSGYIAYCEGGRLEGQRGRAVAFDNDNRKIKEFRGNNGDRLHQQNFIDAVRERDRSILNAEVETGNASTGWCNLANIAFLAAENFDAGTVEGIETEQWQSVVSDMNEHVAVHGAAFDGEAVKLSAMLSLDENGNFVGENADTANKFIKREYREGYEVPEIAVASATG
ncbi:MAG: Gfo/Idh/MocA family oxidoreductase [Planctomycetota bacterium]